MVIQKLIPNNSSSLFVGYDDKINSGFNKVEEALCVYKYPLDYYLSLESPKDEPDLKNGEDSVVFFVEIRHLLRKLLKGKYEVGYFLFSAPRIGSFYTPHLDQITAFASECFKAKPFENYTFLLEYKMRIIKSFKENLYPSSFILSMIRDMLVAESLLKGGEFSPNIIQLIKNTKIERQVKELLDINAEQGKLGQAKWFSFKYLIEDYQENLRRLAKKKRPFDYEELVKKGSELFRKIIT